MSFGGMLATALAGGAGAIKDQATGDIEQRRRIDIAREQAAIQEQMQMRLAEFSERQRREGVLWNTKGEGADAALGFQRKSAEQAQDVALKGEIAKAQSPELMAAEDAKAAAELKRRIAAGEALLPLEVKRAAALADASARASAKYRERSPTIADKIAELEKATGEKLTPEQRKQVGMAFAGLKGGDPDSATQTVEERQYDENGQEVRKVTRKERVQSGAPMPGAIPQAAVEMLRQKPELAEAFDAKYGAGSAKKVLGDQPAKPAEKKDAGPGMLSSIVGAVRGSMTEGAELGNRMEAVRAKIRAGQPLSSEEQAIANRYGIR